MKAAVYYKSKGLVVEEVPCPEITPDQVLVKVSNTGFCGSDHSIIEGEGTPDGLILGHEVSGIVVEPGKKVTGVKPGTRVMIRPTFCGECPECRMGKTQLCSVDRYTLGIGGNGFQGGFAEYVKVLPQMLISIPDNVDSQSAALAETFAVGLHAVNCVRKKSGSALIIGGGAIGQTLVRILKLRGFRPVTVSEPVAEKRAIALTYGADAVIDPLAENLNFRMFELTGGVGNEIVFECSGIPAMVQASMDLVGKGGTVCVVSVISKNIEISPLTLTFKEIWLTAAYGNTHQENRTCLAWMAEGKLDAAPMISDRITLEELPDVYKNRIHTGQANKVMLQIGEEF